jgi:hypothetical protein
VNICAHPWLTAFNRIKAGEMVEILTGLINLAYCTLSSIAMRVDHIADFPVTWRHDGFVVSVMSQNQPYQLKRLILSGCLYEITALIFTYQSKLVIIHKIATPKTLHRHN